MRLQIFWGFVVFGLLSCSGQPESIDDLEAQKADSQGFIEWASDHATTIESLSSSSTEVDGELFRDAIGQAQIVGLGESRHDSREQLLMKGLLVRFLVEEMGFRALILEESFPHAESLDTYVTTGEGDLRGIMNRLAGWYLWDTEEMLELFSWIRSFNEGRTPDDHVRIFGVDVTAPAIGVEHVLDTLDSAGVSADLDVRALGIDLQEGNFWPRTWQRYSMLSDERKIELAANYGALITTMGEARGRLIASSSEREYEKNLWLAEIGRIGNTMFSTADRARAGAVREHGMAQTLLWILEHEIDGGRAILWAHNLHVAKEPFQMPGFVEGDLEPMGVELARQLGDGYVAIGGSFGSGTYPADLPPGERSFEVMAENTMDGALAAVAVPMFIIDLREAAQDPSATTWLLQEREWRAQDSNAVLVPSEAFDLVYFVTTISRSKPTPMALESFQELQQQH